MYTLPVATNIIFYQPIYIYLKLKLHKSKNQTVNVTIIYDGSYISIFLNHSRTINLYHGASFPENYKFLG